MKKFKHNKFKNTGIIFELLSKQVASDVLTNKGNRSLNIIKRYFKEGTELYKELTCYHALTETRNKKEPLALKFLDGILKQRQTINERQLLKEKYKLIGEIKTNYPIATFFESRVSDYKLLASIYKIFEFNLSDNPVGHIDCYETIVEHLTTNLKIIKKQNDLQIVKESEEVRKLAFKILIERFNTKYSFLNIKQKKLVSKFINENTSLPPFKNYVYSEIAEIKQSLLAISKRTKDPVLKIKLTEIANLTSEISASTRIKDEHISSMIKYYELIDHLSESK